MQLESDKYMLRSLDTKHDTIELCSWNQSIFDSKHDIRLLLSISAHPRVDEVLEGRRLLAIVR